MSVKDKVLFIGNLNKSLPEYTAFEAKYECIHYDITKPTREELFKDFREKFHDVKAIYGAWLGFITWQGFQGEIAEKCLPPGLKVLSVCSVGHNDYDGPLLASRGVALTNVPAFITGAADKVADCVLYHTLESFRHFLMFSRSLNDVKEVMESRALINSSEYDSATGNAVHCKSEGYCLGQQFGGRPILSPAGHRVVIVGFGSIGQAISQRLNAIGMKIAYVKRTPLSEAESARFPYAMDHVSYEDGLRMADLLVFVVPGSPETTHMLNETTLRLTKPGVRIINAGRGTAWDEKAIVAGIQSGHIGHVGMDVFEREPAVEPELFNRPADVSLTPHIGSVDMGTWNTTTVYALSEIDRVLQGQEPLSRVN